MRLGVVGAWLVVAALVTCGDVFAQTEDESSADEQAAIERSEELAAQAEEREREEEEARRRRREPNETKIYRGEDKQVRITWGYWHVDGPDYAQIETLDPGSVVEITISAPAKLWTDVALTFDGGTVEAGNVAENYPGVYSIWLKRTADGWSAVFNNKPDVWGTMYDPSVDVVEAPLTHTVADERVEEFDIEIAGSGDGGTIDFAWGEHRWSLPFTYGG